MDPFSVVIAGGGVGALEGLLRVRQLLGDQARITLIAPNEDYSVRALSVKEPFALGAAKRHSVGQLARDANAEWIKDTLAWVDPDGQIAHTGSGPELPYDALLVAVGARTTPAYEHVTTFSDSEADALLHGIVEDIEAGYTKSLAFIAPPGPVWELPLYELALMTAERADSMGMHDIELAIMTPDEAPLAVFGSNASNAVSRLLDNADIAVHSSTIARVLAARRVQLQPQDIELGFDRIIALPRMSGPAIRGLPAAGADGFIPIDAHCAVPGAGGRVFAAGDGTEFPVKHGGLGAEQADTAAVAIARLGGVEVDASPFQPVMRGMLLTGRGPLYMTAELLGTGSFESKVSDEPLWPSGHKVAAEELAGYIDDNAR